MNPRRSVTVQFLKNPDHLHWGFEAYWLGEDKWGNWISVPAGTKRWRGTETVRPTRFPAVFCASREDWWHLHYNSNTTRYSHFVDIVTPPVWVSEHRYEMIDLDLDVAVAQDGEIEVQDEDEFAVHQVQYGYSAQVISRAESATALVVEMLEQRREPFFTVAEEWFQRALSP